MSKKKLAGIIIACTIVVVVGIVLVIVKPWDGAPSTDIYILTTVVSPSGAGYVSPLGGAYVPGDHAMLTASPASGYTFDYWDGDATGSSNTITITMDSDKSITANFKAQYSLSTSVSPSGCGTVSPTIGTYDEGTQVEFTAVPSSGYTFDHWGGDASGAVNPVTITMTSNMNVIAYFTLSSWTISAAEAQQAVQSSLDIMGNVIPIEGFSGPRLPNGVEVPKNAKAGTPTLVEIDGIPAWEVPVLSNSVRIGEIYVKQIQSTPNQIEFVNFG